MMPVIAQLAAAAPPAETLLPDWMLESLFWISLCILLALLVATAGIWSQVTHLRRMREECEPLGLLEEVNQKLQSLMAARDELDLRRLEHLLIDIRDGQKRLEEAQLRLSEHGTAQVGEAASSEALSVPLGQESIGERVVNRLLAMGYEQVQIITRAEKLSELRSQDGEVLVEAKRGGVLHKGRVSLRSGRLSDVSMNPAYSIFP